MLGFEAGSGISKATSSKVGSTGWYYPGLVTSSNRFYVQTASGLATVAGCSYRGYLPLWAEIKSKGYFFVYEWYPKTSTPLVRLWGWSVPGCKKGWFTGDVPGWHVISYYCGAWSNYIYIYVYPSMYSSIRLHHHPAIWQAKDLPFSPRYHLQCNLRYRLPFRPRCHLPCHLPGSHPSSHPCSPHCLLERQHRLTSIPRILPFPITACIGRPPVRREA